MNLPKPDELATLVVQHRVRPGQSAAYEAWLGGIMPIAQGFTGHLGVSVLRPAAPTQPYTVVLRFDNPSHLQAWVNSPERRELIAIAGPLLLDPDRTEVQAGAAFWFTPEGVAGHPPPRWKQAVLTVAVIFPLTLVVPWLWEPVFQLWPWLGSYFLGGLLIATTIVVPVVYLIMPTLTRTLSGWLTR